MAILPSAFENYEDVSYIGGGAFGEVYRAYDTELRREVAIKVPHLFMLTDPSFVSGFMREAQIAASLNHPNIVRVYKVKEYEGFPYIEMEFVPGNTLADEMKDGKRMSTQEMLPIVEQICAGLDYAHKQKLVHGDIKPGNILLKSGDAGYRRQVLITDFGLAQMLDESQQKSLSDRKSLVGTAQYMAPEQFDEESGDIGPQSDIYSLGVIVYRLTTGRLPFDRATFIKLGYAHVHETPLAPSALVPNLEKSVDKVVLKALAKQPGDRYDSADEFFRDLEKALKPKGEVPLSNRDQSTKEQNVVHLPWGEVVAAVAAILTLIVAVVAFFVPGLPTYENFIYAVIGVIAALFILALTFVQLRSNHKRTDDSSSGISISRTSIEVVSGVVVVALLVIGLFGFLALLAYFDRSPIPPPPLITPTIEVMNTPYPTPTPELGSAVHNFQEIEIATSSRPSAIASTDLSDVATGEALMGLQNWMKQLNEDKAYALLTIDVEQQEPLVFSDNSGYVIQQQRRSQLFFDQDTNQQLGVPQVWAVRMIYRLKQQNGDWIVDAFREDGRMSISQPLP